MLLGSGVSYVSLAFFAAAQRRRRILEQIQVGGYPEGQSSTPDYPRDAIIRTFQEENLDHGCPQAEDVAREHP